MGIGRSIVDTLAAGGSPERAFPARPVPSTRVARSLGRVLRGADDEWTLAATRSPRVVRAWAVVLGAGLVSMAWGLRYVWRTPIFWLGLATLALLVAILVWWYRPLVHTVERHGDELLLRRLRRPPVRLSIAAIDRISVLDTVGVHRTGMGDSWEVPVARTRITFADGTTVGTDHVLRSKVLAELMARARPDLEVRSDLPLARQRFTYELGGDTRILAMGKNRSGPLLLLTICAVGFLGFASVVAWAEARPDIPGTSPAKAAAALRALAAAHPVGEVGPAGRSDVTDCTGSLRRFLWWDGDATTHRIAGRAGVEVSPDEIAAIRARAAELGVTAPGVPPRPDLVEFLAATVDGTRLELQVYATSREDLRGVVFVVRTPCLRGPRSAASTTTQEDARRLATWVVRGS